MLIEADRCPTLYTSHTAQRRAQPPPNLPDRRRIFPDQTSAVRDRDPPTEKSEDWGNAHRAHLPPYPCVNVSQSAQEMRRDLLTRAWDAVHVASGGDGRVFTRRSPWVARKLQGIVSCLLDRVD